MQMIALEATSIAGYSSWIFFILLILALLALDLGVFHKQAHALSFKQAVLYSVFWIGVAMLFNLWLWFSSGSDHALEFLTGYLIEKALSVDNIFVFIILFRYFSVPGALQHKVLFYGILGALVMRGAFIALGAVLLSKFHFIIYIFGGLLVVTGVKLFREEEIDVQPEGSFLYRFAKKFLPLASDYHNAKFVIKHNKRWLATPLLLVLIAIEATDLVFAIDSIPAIFAITKDPYIVFTSNIFAILGLRALYFLLQGAMTKLKYLRFGLAIILIFIGIKMLISGMIEIPIVFSLLMIAIILTATIALSLRVKDSSLEKHEN
jgi:tellurite resistance protein TerC